MHAGFAGLAVARFARGGGRGFLTSTTPSATPPRARTPWPGATWARARVRDRKAYRPPPADAAPPIESPSALTSACRRADRRAHRVNAAQHLVRNDREAPHIPRRRGLSPASCSGDMYASVPTCRARPGDAAKSSTFGTSTLVLAKFELAACESAGRDISSILVRKMFSGLKSRCTMPCVMGRIDRRCHALPRSPSARSAAKRFPRATRPAATGRTAAPSPGTACRPRRCRSRAG